MQFLWIHKRWFVNTAGIIIYITVPHFYECPIDGYGNRRDLEDRPELRFGSVDFVATKDYMTRMPAPINYVILLDVSQSAYVQNVTSSVLGSFKQIIKDLAKSNLQSKFSIITFSRNVYFYNLKGFSNF